MKLQRVFAGLVAAVAMAVLSQVASASHIFSTDIQINGVPVAAGGSFTNPIIVIDAGDSVTFSFDLFGSAGTFNATFSGAGSLPAPTNQSFAYDGSGTAGTPLVYSFSQIFNTPGTFTGFLNPDFPVSSPDYIFPNGNQIDNASIPFQLIVNAVPEPASLLAWGLIAGMGAVGYRMRKRRAQALAV